MDGKTGGTILPWGAHKERTPYPSCVNIDVNIKPGEFVMRTLFADFTVQAERKMEAVMNEPLVKINLKNLTPKYFLRSLFFKE